MAKLVFVVGKSGHGKSTSMMNLNPESTVIINSDSKDLPFPGAHKKYTEDENIFHTSNVPEIVKVLQKANSNPKVKSVVLDTWSRTMTDAVMDPKFRANSGYEKWATYSGNQYDLIGIVNKNMRKDIIVYFMAHPEIIFDEMGRQVYRVQTQGKQLDAFVPESFSTVVLYTEVVDNPGKVPDFHFRTVTRGNDTCKAPLGMFDKDLIPNDLKIVEGAIRKYTGIE